MTARRRRQWPRAILGDEFPCTVGQRFTPSALRFREQSSQRPTRRNAKELPPCAGGSNVLGREPKWSGHGARRSGRGAELESVLFLYAIDMRRSKPSCRFCRSTGFEEHRRAGIALHSRRVAAVHSRRQER